LLHPTLASATCRTGNLHGELLSVHKIKLGLPWRTEDAERMGESGVSSSPDSNAEGAETRGASHSPRLALRKSYKRLYLAVDHRLT